MKKYFILLFLLLPLLISGCGEETASSGSTITITPESMSVTDGSSTSSWHSNYFVITVTSSSGKPAGNIKINISATWAYPDTYNFIRLYDGNTLKSSPFEATTDESGSYLLRFDYQSGGGLEYSSDCGLMVTSGSATGCADFEIAAD